MVDIKINILHKQSGSLHHYGHFIHDFIMPVIHYMYSNSIEINHIYLLIKIKRNHLKSFKPMAEKLLNLTITQIKEDTEYTKTLPLINLKAFEFGPYNPCIFTNIIPHITKTLLLPESSYKIILIERGISATEPNSGAIRRKLNNHQQLKNILTSNYKNMFRNVILEHISIEEQIALFMNATIVIGQHGAGLCNIIWMTSPNSLVIEFPPFAVDTFKHMCISKKIKYVRSNPIPTNLLTIINNHIIKNAIDIKIDATFINRYILLRCRTGLNDCLYELFFCTQYAIQHKCKIILEWMMYSATNLSDIFDFSEYPVEIILDSTILENLQNLSVIPKLYTSQLINPTDVIQKGPLQEFTLNNTIIDFDRNRSFINNSILVRDGWGRERNQTKPSEFKNQFKYLKFTTKFIEMFKEIQVSFPDIYNSVYIRDTDKLHVYSSNPLEGVNKFIKDSNLPVFIASDNSNNITALIETFGEKILKSNTKYYNNSGNLIKYNECNLHQYGTLYPDVLQDAIIDLLLLSYSNTIFFTTMYSGYSCLINTLNKNKDILSKLIEIKN